MAICDPALQALLEIFVRQPAHIQYFLLEISALRLNWGVPAILLGRQNTLQRG